MKAQLKSGKVISGKLAETLGRLGIARKMGEGEEPKKPVQATPKPKVNKVKAEKKPKVKK
jgi:hypothetical protein